MVPQIHLFFSPFAVGHVISSENFSPKTKIPLEMLHFYWKYFNLCGSCGVGCFSCFQCDIQMEVRLLEAFHSLMQHVSFSWLVGFLTFKRVFATEDFLREIPSK